MSTTQGNATEDSQRTIAELRKERDAALVRETALAETQAVIALENARLLGELEERTAALAQRNSEYGERIEQQAATIDVLEAMSSSPGDPQPVFDLIAERAREFCEADGVAVAQLEGDLLQLRSHRGMQPVAKDYEALFPLPVSTASMLGRAILARDAVRTRDTQVDPDFGLKAFTTVASRSMIAVPLLRAGTPIGAIALGRNKSGDFSTAQVQLLQTFAEQAVIAICSAETYHELNQRTGDLQEALEYQTATSDVLKVISRSTFDLQPVLDTLVETAARLCDADQGVLARPEGDLWRLAANFGFPPEFEAFQRERGLYALDPDAPNVSARAVREGRPVHVHDVAAIPGYPEIFTRLAKQRTSLGVPLLREGEAIGYIVLARQRVEPFTDRQIELVSTFADQAVIAIENTRLITEQREALERQTATAEVLQVINASAGDLAPVFDAVLEKALDLCGAAFGVLWTFDGEQIHAVAHRGAPPEFAEFLTRTPHPVGPDNAHGRLLHGEPVVHIADVREDKAFRSDDPLRRTLVELGGGRTLLAVPLRKDEAFLGDFVIYRRQVRPFSDKQIALLQSFAAQAVVAMENARLLTELQQRTDELTRRNSEYGERIEQQAATIDVLKAMSASSGDAQPVFRLIVERARAFCDADNANLALVDGDMLHVQATTITGSSENVLYMAQFPRPVDATSMFGRAILARDAVQTPDVRADPQHFTKKTKSGEATVRSLVAVPLLRAGAPLGAIVLARNLPGEFSATQVELLRTFSEQAVIAISSAQAYRALQERTDDLQESLEYQTATSDVLKVISRSAFDLDPVFRAVVATAVRLCHADQATIYRYQDGEYRWAAGYGLAPDYEVIERECRIRPGTGTLVGRVALEGRTVQILDAWTDPLYEVKEDARVGGVHTMLGVPLLRDGVPIGVIGLARRRIEPYSERHIALVSTFAEQAVIAIGSVTTFQALQERTAELTRSVAELQALEEVLRAVNSSLDLDTVLATIISRAAQLSQADEGTIYEFDEAEEVFVPRSAYGMTEERVAALRERKIRLGETHLGRAALLRAPVHVADVQQDPMIADAGGLLRGIHAVLAVPLLWDEKVVGGLVIRRRTVGGFAPSIPTLLQTFAGQAVLAIENAELFQEARRARTAAEAALTDLRRTQDRLVQTEKMASLGQLTAGIAHEIKNPLNFVNNFSELSVDLLNELYEAVAPGKLAVADGLRAEIDEITTTLKGNLEKIAEHGRRADSIVKNMLLHSRTGPSEHRAIDLNTTVEEALNLAYHGARAETPGFNITMEKDLDPKAGTVDLYPQEFIRVMLNLIGNGFYAARNRANPPANPDYEPTLRLTTRDLGGLVEIRVRDNGTGINDAVRDKIFEPFFTTKPSGEGTGLGLSLSYDIVVKQHGGLLTVDSQIDAFTEFTITLPRRMTTIEGGTP